MSVVISTFGTKERYTLVCSVTGIEALPGIVVNILWRAPDGSVRISGRTTLDLCFDPLQQSDAGVYTCEATIIGPFFNVPAFRSGTVNVDDGG